MPRRLLLIGILIPCCRHTRPRRVSKEDRLAWGMAFPMGEAADTMEIMAPLLWDLGGGHQR